MNQPKHFFLATGALLVLVSVLALITQSPSQSQGQSFSSLPVQVVNGSATPVPVTGTVGLAAGTKVGIDPDNAHVNVTITGTPTAALVAGTKVGIDPAANAVSLASGAKIGIDPAANAVSLASGAKIGIDPAANTVNLASASPLPIASSVANPVIVRTADAVAQIPFQGEVSAKAAAGANTATGLLTFPGGGNTVPAGKRLLIREVSAGATLFGSLGASLSTTTGGSKARHFLFLQQVGFNPAGFSRFVGTQAMEAYADPGTQVSVDVTMDFGQGAGEVLVATIAGYLVPAP